ncbi:MAG: hypothetical protein DIAAKJNI_00407 [Candidatus Argoarchaeum ethanivorans]|uniref:Uncharacterized protein n=1 Tax=Candidatus Argoarchaeum ethanivorans TaxID=2608793 RepID=A0A811TB02_9EURY|nr:MAG: hypothetical protein DIAAKJNI_00407 [Candidatus Argoarchaeum ethanivorans]
MSEKQHRFSIIFEELDRLSVEPEIRFESGELEEYEEIQALRKIVLEMQNPVQTYFAST